MKKMNVEVRGGNVRDGVFVEKHRFVVEPKNLCLLFRRNESLLEADKIVLRNTYEKPTEGAWYSELLPVVY